MLKSKMVREILDVLKPPKNIKAFWDKFKQPWVQAVLITLISSIFQRLTGPTYPIRGKFEINQSTIRYKLARSHAGSEDHQVKIEVPDTTLSGRLIYKRYKTDDPWTTVPMTRDSVYLVAKLPHQPPAGKLMYKINLFGCNQPISLPEDKPIIIRFRGAVPAVVLLPHIFLMFFAMLLSNRAGLEALNKERNPRIYALWATGLLFAGGMLLGPIVQKLAFGEFWSGIPFGHDLTDSKTLIAMIAWIAAVIAGRGGKPARGWVLTAAIILLVIYLIPHSLLGSELDYSKMAPPSE